LTYSCTNAKYEDYKKPAYEKDLDIMFDFLDKLDYKKEFSVAVKQMLRNETFFCSPRMEGNSFVLQELPSTPAYTKITGRWDYGLLFSFNMYWFMQGGIDIDLYPAFFKKKLAELYGVGKSINKIYDPSISVLDRGASHFVFWQDIPVDVGWVFKMSPEVITRVPYFTPLFNDLVIQSLMRNLQKNINMSVAKRLIIGEVGTLKEPTAKLKDQFNISPNTLGSFLSVVKSAISEAVQVAALPLENVKSIGFEAENDVYNTYLKTTLASSGVNSNLVFTSDLKPNTIETQLSLNTDEQLMTSLYSQFNAFLNYNINKLTKKYKFAFEFEGTQFYNNRQLRLDTQISLTDKGIVMPQKIAAAIGMKPQTMHRQMEEARAMGWVDTLTPIISSFQMGKDDSKGRPQKPDSELTDSGESTRSTGNNIPRGKGKI